MERRVKTQISQALYQPAIPVIWVLTTCHQFHRHQHTIKAQHQSTFGPELGKTLLPVIHEFPVCFPDSLIVPEPCFTYLWNLPAGPAFVMCASHFLCWSLKRQTKYYSSPSSFCILYLSIFTHLFTPGSALYSKKFVLDSFNLCSVNNSWQCNVTIFKQLFKTSI